LGEIIEWGGYALLTWSLPVSAFYMDLRYPRAAGDR
jgi:hypothetical protein